MTGPTWSPTPACWLFWPHWVDLDRVGSFSSHPKGRPNAGMHCRDGDTQYGAGCKSTQVKTKPPATRATGNARADAMAKRSNTVRPEPFRHPIAAGAG